MELHATTDTAVLTEACYMNSPGFYHAPYRINTVSCVQ